MKPLLLLDLDRTLFATDLFRGYVVNELVQITGKTHRLIESMMLEHSEAVDNYLRHTDFSGLLRVLNVPENIAYEAISAVVPTDSLLLPDVPDFLKWLDTQDIYEPRILSLGQTKFQQLKLATCPSLSTLPADIILKRKNSYIQTHYSQRTGALIDDKARQDLPIGWLEITITRSAPNAASVRQKADNVWEITTLAQARELLI